MMCVHVRPPPLSLHGNRQHVFRTQTQIVCCVHEIFHACSLWHMYCWGRSFGLLPKSRQMWRPPQPPAALRHALRLLEYAGSLTGFADPAYSRSRLRTPGQGPCTLSKPLQQATAEALRNAVLARRDVWKKRWCGFSSSGFRVMGLMFKV